MSDVMVSARMSAAKKEAGNRVLEGLGCNASQVVNELYDYLIKEKKLPWAQEQSMSDAPVVSQEELQASLAWIDSLQVELSPEFAVMTTKDAKRHRLQRRTKEKA